MRRHALRRPHLPPPIEAAGIIGSLSAKGFLASDHYTNYIDVRGRLPKDLIRKLLGELDHVSGTDRNFLLEQNIFLIPDFDTTRLLWRVNQGSPT